MSRRLLNRWLLFCLLLVCLVLVARIGERHKVQIDLSAGQINSLSAAATNALDALPGPLDIKAYAPDYPVQRAQIQQQLAPYLDHAYPNHAGATTLTFIDPVKDPQLARAAGVAGHGELHLHVGDRREVVANPSRAAIDAALARLARQGDRWIVSLKGHGEALIDQRPDGLGHFVDRVETLGYRALSLDPRQLDRLPENTAVLLVAGPTRAYGTHVDALIARFIEEGGSVLWLVDSLPIALPALNLDIQPLPGVIVDAAAAQYGLADPDNAIVSDYPALLTNPPGGFSTLKRARGLQWSETPAWRVAGRLTSSARSWNETGALSGTLKRDPQLKETRGPLTVGLALERDASQSGARLFVLGSRHMLGNSGIGQGNNLQLATAIVHWLSGNDRLSPARAAPDLDIRWSPTLAGILAVALMAVLPALYLATGLWLRARRRRA